MFSYIDQTFWENDIPTLYYAKAKCSINLKSFCSSNGQVLFLRNEVSCFRVESKVELLIHFIISLDFFLILLALKEIYQYQNCQQHWQHLMKLFTQPYLFITFLFRVNVTQKFASWMLNNTCFQKKFSRRRRMPILSKEFWYCLDLASNQNWRCYLSHMS